MGRRNIRDPAAERSLRTAPSERERAGREKKEERSGAEPFGSALFPGKGSCQDRHARFRVNCSKKSAIRARKRLKSSFLYGIVICAVTG